MSAPMLPPPLAWLRQSGWGRDITTWAREEERQFLDDEMVWAMTNDDDEPIKAIVSLARFRRILGNTGIAALEIMAAKPPEEGASLYRGLAHEQVMAVSLANWIENGERMETFGPDLSKSFLEDETADTAVTGILNEGGVLYLRFEGIEVPSFDGRLLDGFMIIGVENDEGRRAEIVAFSRSPIPLNQSQSLRPNIPAWPLAEPISISTAILRAADASEEAIPELRLLTTDVKAEGTSYSHRQKAMINGLNPAADIAMVKEFEMLELQIVQMRENAVAWGRLIGGALRTIATQQPPAHQAYPAEAPQHLASAALSEGRQAQRAVKKLRSEGWPRMVRHELGVETPTSLDLANVEAKSEETGSATTQEALDAHERKVLTQSERSAEQGERRNRRRERRVERLAAEKAKRDEASAAKVEAWKKQAADQKPAPTPSPSKASKPEKPSQKPQGTCQASPVEDRASDGDHASWEAVSRPCGRLDEQTDTSISRILSVNAVTRTVARALREGSMPAEACSAVSRHFSSMASAEKAFVDALTSPDIGGDADLSAVADRDGALVVSDRALFEYASPGRIGPIEPMRETAMTVLYRIRRSGMDTLIVQVDADGRLNLLQWANVPLSPVESDDDLAWYLRCAVAMVAEGAMRPEPVKQAASSKLLPATPTAKPRPEVGEPPRRVVAQVRIRPDDLSIAQTVASRWFDAQVVRHGDMLVADRRQDGEWTIEHRSEVGPDRARWSVTLRVCREQPTLLDIIVRTTLASGAKPRLPTLIREIAEATPTEGLDGYLETSPTVVRDRGDVTELMRELQDPDRDLPILLMTPDRDGRWLADPQAIARQSLGALTVRLVDAECTYDLTDALGQEYRTFGGAVRLFQPRFDPDQDIAARHPRIMPGNGAERSLADMITRATAMTVTRYPIPDTEPTQAPAPAPIAAPQRPPVATALPASRKATLPSVQAVSEAKPAEEPSGEAAEPKKIVHADGPTKVGDAPSGKTAVEAPKPSPSFLDQASVERMIEAEVGRRMAAMPVVVEKPSEPEPEIVEVEQPLPMVMPEQPFGPPAPPAPEPKPAAIDQRDLDDRIARSVNQALSNSGVPDLVAAIGTLVGRIDSLIGANAPVATLTPVLLETSLEIAQRDETIVGLREELRADRETAEDLLSETDARRMAAEDEVAVLRAALNDRRRETDRRAVVTVEQTFPSELSGLADWLKDNVLPNVVVTSKAYRGMRKVRFTDMERLCTTLKLLDGPYVDMRSGIAGARDRWLEGLKTLRLDNKKQSEGGKSIRGGAEYRFTHDGDSWEMDWHIRGLESLHNDTERLLRIYFAYDEAKGRVLIGHMPTHLATVDS